jgi:RNA polymerase sigma factor (TIGR02999 family)
MSLSKPDVTTLLGLTRQGDAQAQEDLFRLVEAELRKCAHARLRQGRQPHDLQTTMLVDDAFVKLVGNTKLTWENRSQFFCLAARAMREILVDEARRHAAGKRGGGRQPADLHRVAEPIDPATRDPLSVLALHEALIGLATTNPELIQIVELHHFGGWDLKQIAAEILRVPYTTVKRRWQKARAVLHAALHGDDHDAKLSRESR